MSESKRGRAQERARVAGGQKHETSYEAKKTGTSSGEVREASQDHFRGGRDEPMSAEALQAKVIANCIYGGWDADRARNALATLRGLRVAPAIDLTTLRG